MSDGVRVECQVHLHPLRKSPEPRTQGRRRPLANLQKALLLGHQIVWAIATGEFTSQTQVARYIGVTEMRVSQLVAFTLLAPAIQHRLLALPKNILGRIPEQRIRPIVGMLVWADQVRAWEALLAELDVAFPLDT